MGKSFPPHIFRVTETEEMQDKPCFFISRLVFLSSVCFNISDSAFNMNSTQAELLEERTNNARCNVNGWTCFFQCTFSEMAWFNGSSHCSDADVETSANGDKIAYSFKCK